MGLTVVFARLNETTAERQITAPSSARLTDETNFEGKLKSSAGAAHEAHHMSAATITPSASGGTFNPRPPRLAGVSTLIFDIEKTLTDAGLYPTV
jgi:hypothetical protein